MPTRRQMYHWVLKHRALTDREKKDIEELCAMDEAYVFDKSKVSTESNDF
jgi:hypothetical protein